MRRLHKFLALSPAGRAIVLQSLLLLPAVAVLLRARGMARTTALLGRMTRPAARDPAALAPPETARLVNAVGSFLRLQCLPRSMVLCHFLRQRGMPAELRLGVSRLPDGALSAHAWVELEGQPLDDSADLRHRYAAFPASATELRGRHP